MVNRAANVTTVGSPHDYRCREVVVGSPAHSGQLVTQLHVRGPDVVEELDLDDRLEPTHSESDRAAHDIRLGQRRVVDTGAAEFLLQSPRYLEHAPFPFDFPEVLLAGYVGNVLPEDENLLIPPHLVLHARVEQVD